MLDLRVFAILAAMAAVLTIPANAVVHLERLLPHLPLWQQALDLFAMSLR